MINPIAKESRSDIDKLMGRFRPAGIQQGVERDGKTGKRPRNECRPNVTACFARRAPKMRVIFVENLMDSAGLKMT